MQTQLSFRDFLHTIDKLLQPYRQSICKIMKVHLSDIDFLLSGKRLRSKFLYHSTYIASMELKLKLGTLIELIHAASLIHDDIVDESILRRGYSTLQQSFSMSKTINTGYSFFSQIFMLILQLPPSWQNRFFSALSDMCIGELWEIEGMFEDFRTLNRYVQTIQKKTAVLFALCCGLKETDAWDNDGHKFGLSFGMAFQMLDDLLDLVASTELLGKPTNKDVQMGIETLPLFLNRQYAAYPKYSLRKSISIGYNYLEKAKKHTFNSSWLLEADLLKQNFASLLS